jgi:hypothetical protein
MRTRRIVVGIGIATAIGASAFLLVGPPAAVAPLQAISVVDSPAGALRFRLPAERPRQRSGAFADAQPCLIDTVSCLELAPEPFAPCLLALERCSGEWRLHPLAGRKNAD